MRKRQPLAERLWRLTDRTGSCWLWLGNHDPNGYARITMPTGKRGGRLALAHRVMYELIVEPVPIELSLDHLCRNPGCVNPSHLDPVDHRENVLRGVSPTAINARKTHCPQGHPYDSFRSDGYRRCLTCRREQARAYRRRRKVAA